MVPVDGPLQPAVPPTPASRALATRLRAMDALTDRLAGLATREEIASALVSEAPVLVACDTVRLYRVDHGDGMCVALPGPGESPDDAAADSVPVGRGLVGLVAQHGEPLAVEDVDAEPHSVRRPGLWPGDAALVVPLSFARRVDAVLALSRHAPGRFTADDVVAATVFAGFAAQALASVANVERLARQQAELQHLAESQRKLLEVNERLLSTLDPRGVLDLIADSLLAVVRYDNLTIYRVDRAERLFRAVLARDRFAPLILDAAFPVAQGITGWVYSHGEAQCVNDAHLDARMHLVPGTPIEAESLIVVPLVAGREVVGTLNVSRMGGQEAHFSPSEFELTKLFAGQASIALQNAEAHREVSTRADTDALTSLRNHGAFERDLARMAVDPHARFALLMLDLDGFKAFNDRRGHPAGNVHLQSVALAIRGAIRDDDLAYRYGGDEFAVLLPGANAAQAAEVAERVRAAIAALSTGGSGTVGASVGVAVHPDDATAREALVAAADAALYTAKATGGDRVRGRDRARGDEPDAAPRPGGERGPRNGVGEAADAVPATAAETAAEAVVAARVPEHAFLADVSMLHAGEPGQDAIATLLLQRAGEVLGAAAGWVALRTADGAAMEIRATRGGFEQYVGTRTAPGEGLAGRVWASGTTVVVDDYLAWEGRVGGYRELPRSLAAVPLRVDGEVDGMLVVGHLEPGVAFAPEQLGRLERFAHLASLALGHARLAAALEEERAARCEAEAGEARAESRFRAFAQHVSDLVLILDSRGGMRYASPSLERQLGRTWDEMVGASRRELVHPADWRLMRAVFGRLMRSPGGSVESVVRLRHVDGSWHTFETTARNLLDDPAIEGIVITGRDVTEERRFEDELARRAFYDPLTGLANRALFSDRLRHALDREVRRDGSVAVLLLDLDRFALVNDGLGHAVGDELLIASARRIVGCLRPGDTVARFGGDEFAVLLDEVADHARASVVARRIRDGLAAPVTVAGREIAVSASIGIVVREARDAEPAELLRDADVALNQAKGRTTERQAVFEPAMGRGSVERLDLESDLRRALRRSELVLHYQPIVELATRRVVGAEALVRWQHPTRGLLYPDTFIPLAEETGLILGLGRWVLETACRQARAWQERSTGDPLFAISVNLSAAEFTRHELPGEVAAVLERTGLPARSLTLEITESALMQDREGALDVARALHALGVGLVIDDFGVGYSSLAYLRHLPVVGLKIDRSFVAGLAPGRVEMPIVQSVVALAHGLAIDATAEGIETADQLSVLQGLACQHGQGYHFSRPVPAEAFTGLLFAPGHAEGAAAAR